MSVKYLYRILEEFTFLVHILIVVLILLGWAWSFLYYLYGLVLFLTIASWLIWKRCILVDIEGFFRTKTQRESESSQGSFIVFWLHKILGTKVLDDKFVFYWGGLFLSVSMMVWVGNFFNLFEILLSL